ncbi:phage integrase family protein [Rhizobium sp. BK376]|nr:phage integrase family protein [Rhizobium sp. BK376]
MDKKYDSILKLAAQDPDFVGATEFKRLAADVGISAFPDDVEAVPVSDLIEVVGANLDAIQSLPSDPKVRAGALASALNSKLKIEEIYTRYKEITRDKDLKRTPREFQKAHKPIELAMTELVETIGDLDVRKLTKRDAYRFRDKLISDVSIKKITASTANKKIMHLRKIVSAVFEVDYPELPNPFQIKGIEDSVRGHRKAFSESEIEEITLRLKSSTMNDELKAIIFVAMYTGAGCKELALLTSSDIVLDAEIPYIKIDANEFRVKVKSGGDRHREIPLYGEALAWMKRFPNGFARYRRDNGGETVSATARKFLKQYTGKTFYCFRHRLADLLRNSGCEDRLANAILGHKQGVIGNHYGNGYTLKSKYNALAQAHEKGRADLEKDQNIDKL